LLFKDFNDLGLVPIFSGHLIGSGFDYPYAAKEKLKTHDNRGNGSIDLKNCTELLSNDGTDDEKQNW